MANDKKNIKEKKPKFSPYWIYGIVIALFLGFQLFGESSSSGGSKITKSDFFEFLEQGDVEKIDIVKVDAQGHDFEIVKPLVPYFDRISTVKLEVSTNGQYKDTPNTNPSDISRFMNDNGYRLAHFDGGDHYYERIV